MMGIRYLIFSTILFQVIWALCVFDIGPWNLIAVALFVAFHMYVVQDKRRALTVVLVASVMGPSLDAIQVYLGYMTFSGVEAGLIPLWLVGLWVAFGTLFTGSLAWLNNKPYLAILLGAILGPLSYQSAAWLGAVEITLIGLFSLAIVWAFCMYVLSSLASDRFIYPRRPDNPAVS